MKKQKELSKEDKKVARAALDYWYGEGKILPSTDLANSIRNFHPTLADEIDELGELQPIDPSITDHSDVPSVLTQCEIINQENGNSENSNSDLPFEHFDLFSRFR